MPISPAFVIAAAVSAILGGIGGSGFLWAVPQTAWNLFTAMFLWTLITSAGTTIGRYTVERLRRGEWRRGLRIAAVQSVPLVTIFLFVAALPAAVAGVDLAPRTAAVLYAGTVTVGLFMAVLGVLSSPYRQ
jgi:hypothetical protein